MIVFLTLSEPGHQMLRHILFWPFTALALLWSPFCLPMQTHFESLDEVLGKTRLAVVADILSVADQRESEMWRVLTLKAEVVKTVFGGDIDATVLHCRYEEAQPHSRGTLTVSPLVPGSGNEFNVKPGERVVLLIGRAPADSAPCQVLRIEPLSNEGLVKGHRQPG